MATIVERPRRNGQKSYRIQVKVKNRGTGDIITKVATFHPDPTLGIKANNRKLNEFAIEFESQIRAQYERGIAVDRNITVKDFSKVWLQFIRLNRSPSYAKSVLSVINDINDQLGEYKLKELTPGIIQAYVDDLKLGEIHKVNMYDRTFKSERTRLGINMSEIQRRCGVAPITIKRVESGEPIGYEIAEKLTNALGKDNPIIYFRPEEKNREYANSTQARRYRTLRAMLSYAVKKQYIEQNYATSDYIDTIKEKHTPREFLDDDEVKTLLESLRYSDNEPAKIAVNILIFLGLRRGELCGLEWQDIDYKKGIIRIERASKQIPGMGTITGETKTKGSKRKIAMPQILMHELKEYRTWWEQHVYVLGDRYDGCNRLLLSRYGGPINPGTIQGWLDVELKRAGLKRVCVHSLRHSNITIQLAAGVPLNTVAERAGHSTTKMTADIYAHMIKSSNRDAADKLDALLGNLDD